MVNWQVTATTIYCDAVDEEVTVMVYGDMSVKCTGYAKFGQPVAQMLDVLKKKSRQLNRSLGCEGQECHRVIQYKKKLMAKEAVEEGQSAEEGTKPLSGIEATSDE
jgi:hypothetical protein